MPSNLLSQKGLETKLRDARTRGGTTKIADGANLYLVARADGGASWQLNYRLKGKRKTFSIGVYPQVSLASARAMAKQARDNVQLGLDPVDVRRTERAGDREALSVAKLVESWFTKSKVAWSKRHLQDFERAAAADVLPHLGAKRIDAVTPEDLRALLERVEKRGAQYMLTRVHAILRRTFEYALDAGLLKENPMSRVKRRAFTAHQEGHHAAITNPADLAMLVKALHGDKQSMSVLAVRLSVLVFVRPQNLRNAKWSQFDLDAGLWSIPDSEMKARREFLVPLSTQAVELLRNVHTVSGRRALVFPSQTGEPLSDMTLTNNLHRLGYQGIQTVHGFRTTAKTLLEEGGFDSKIVEKQLAHEQRGKVERAYNRAEYLPQRILMMQAWSDYIDAMRVDAQVDAPWEWFTGWRRRHAS